MYDWYTPLNADSGLGKDGQKTEAFANALDQVSRQIRNGGERPWYDLERPIPLQNVLLFVGLGWLALQVWKRK